MAPAHPIHIGLRLLPLMVFLWTGCTHTHTTFLSEHWIEQPLVLYQISSIPTRPTLQVIITYDEMLSSHAALRLVANHGNVTFWDPAGAYGLRTPSAMEAEPTDAVTIQRKRDVVITGIPDIPTYLQFRWYVGDVTVEVFEWDVSRQDAETFERVLQGESVAGREPEVFDTETAPAFCAMAISEFLQRFAGSMMTLPDRYLWPHNLAQALLEQAPARIRVFRQHAREMVYVSPQRSAGPPPQLRRLFP